MLIIIIFEYPKGIDKKLFPDLIFYNTVFKVNFLLHIQIYLLIVKVKFILWLFFKLKIKNQIVGFRKIIYKKSNFFLNIEKKIIGKYPDLKSKSFPIDWILCILLFIIIILILIYY